MLIEAGADINKANSAGRTPLFWARKEGNTEIVDLLLENGAIEGVARGARKKTKARKSRKSRKTRGKLRKTNKKSRKSYKRK